jgi:hypothetical protein
MIARQHREQRVGRVRLGRRDDQAAGGRLTPFGQRRNSSLSHRERGLAESDEMDRAPGLGPRLPEPAEEGRSRVNRSRGNSIEVCEQPVSGGRTSEFGRGQAQEPSLVKKSTK